LQSHQVLDILSHVPDYCHEKLTQLAELPAQVETIKASRTVVLRDLADDTLCCVLENYDFNHTRKRIEVFFKQVLDLSETSDLSFSTKAEDLLEIVENELTYCRENHTFITEKYYGVFVRTIDKVVRDISAKSAAKFTCDIRSRDGDRYTLDKRLPLHLPQSALRISLAFINRGPRTADRVHAIVMPINPDVVLANERIDLGRIAPGTFIVPVTLRATSPMGRVDLHITVFWTTILRSEEQSVECEVGIEAQATNVDWDALRQRQPYSLGVAQGDDFVGREGVLNGVGCRSFLTTTDQ